MGRADRRRARSAQRPLWASTGVKNPDYSDTMYVDRAGRADTVNTMPEKTIARVRRPRRGRRATQVTGTAAQAQEVFDALERVGVDLTDVFQVLEDEGVREVRGLVAGAARHRQAASSTARSEPGALTPVTAGCPLAGTRQCRCERPAVRPVTIRNPRGAEPGLSRMCSGARIGA